MCESNTSQTAQDALYLATASTTVLSALQLMTAAAHSGADRFYTAIRQSDLAAMTELAGATSGILKILGTEPPPPVSTRRDTVRSVSFVNDEADGRPVVT